MSEDKEIEELREEFRHRLMALARTLEKLDARGVETTYSIKRFADTHSLGHYRQIEFSLKKRI